MSVLPVKPPQYILTFTVPTSFLSVCKAAIFAAGAGSHPDPSNPSISKYTEACFVSSGIGQFRPGDTAKPNIGAVGELEEVEEVRLETLCVGEDVARRAVEALKKAHPYETPAYAVFKMEDF